MPESMLGEGIQNDIMHMPLRAMAIFVADKSTVGALVRCVPQRIPSRREHPPSVLR